MASGHQVASCGGIWGGARAEGKKYVMRKAGKKWHVVSEQNFTIMEAFIFHLCICHFMCFNHDTSGKQANINGCFCISADEGKLCDVLNWEFGLLQQPRLSGMIENVFTF